MFAGMVSTEGPLPHPIPERKPNNEENYNFQHAREFRLRDNRARSFLRNMISRPAVKAQPAY
jgi:hypothetical protein